MNVPIEKSALAGIVEELCAGNRRTSYLHDDSPHSGEPLPSRIEIARIVEGLRAVIFPGYFGMAEVTSENMPYYVGNVLDGVRQVLKVQVRRGMCFLCEQKSANTCFECESRSTEITNEFIEKLPELQRILATDVQAAYDGDPAATSPEEVIFSYPGILAIMNYRIAHKLHELRTPLIPRMITENAHGQTGIDIHPGAKIGERFFIDHGTGVVIGETCIIGQNVRIYQGVTLGAKSFPLDEKGNPAKGIARHPVIEDNVIIYSGATILGRVTIGKGSVIGGNVWLTKSIPACTTVTQAKEHSEAFECGSGI